MAVLVTGASGFVGGRLAEVLVEQGEAVTILARASAQLAHLAHLPPSRLRVVRGGLGDAEALGDAVRDVTEIYHCAAASTDWARNEVYLESNVRGTEALLAAARDAPRLRRFLHVSTTDVYGYPKQPCDESGPLVDAGLPYNQSKKLAEEAVWRTAREHGLPVTVVRPSTIYGPRGRAFVTDIAELLRARQMAVVSGGRERGGFIYVDDVVDAMLVAARLPAALGRAYNLCDGRGNTWREYVDGLAAALGLKRPWIDLPFPLAMAIAGAMEAPYQLVATLPGRPLLTRHAVVLLGRDQQFPIKKAQAELAFAPKVQLPEGLARSAAWLLGKPQS